MVGNAIYIKKGCQLYKCDVSGANGTNPLNGNDGKVEENCRLYHCDANECNFLDQKAVNERINNGEDLEPMEIAVREGPKKTYTIYNTIYGDPVDTFELGAHAVGVDIKEAPAFSEQKNQYRQFSKWDLDNYYLKNMRACGGEDGSITSAEISDGPQGMTNLPYIIVNVGGRPISVFTIDPKAGLAKMADQVTEWLKEQEQKKSGVTGGREVVAIFYSKQMKKSAMESADQYIFKGIYAYPIEVSESYVRGVSNTLISDLRRKTLAVAYLPLPEEMKESKLDGEDLNAKKTQNNERIGEIINKLFPGGETPATVYMRYLSEIAAKHNARQAKK